MFFAAIDDEVMKLYDLLLVIVGKSLRLSGFLSDADNCFNALNLFSRQKSHGRKAGSITIWPFPLQASQTVPNSMQFVQ